MNNSSIWSSATTVPLTVVVADPNNLVAVLVGGGILIVGAASFGFYLYWNFYRVPPTSNTNTFSRYATNRATVNQGNGNGVELDQIPANNRTLSPLRFAPLATNDGDEESLGEDKTMEGGLAA